MKRLSAFLAIPLVLTLAACGRDTPQAPRYYGYVEGEYVLVAAPYAGRLDRLSVARGGEVHDGDALFALEQENELAAEQEARDRLRAAQERLANLHAAQRRPEVAALRAQADQAGASRRLSADQLRRDQALFAKGFISGAKLDESRANLARDEARVAEVQARLRLAHDSVGRPKEVAAARADAEAAQAVVDQAKWRLDQRAMRATADARVHDTFYVEGEWVAAGRPVVSLLPPGNVKLRFFVPEAAVSGFRPGLKVVAHCDGCAATIDATVSYVSTQAEFTPPVIYSRKSRAKLVFLVEAAVDASRAGTLNPGQPVDVEVAGR
ncbi:MAG: HlyD family efflux transporter periplasmic adaptor subunit [Betaproteobacteria bacterium]|nr:HlyD family efflux transporter periplasmic adaptor subunit [Betaproteobacteria bacterium]